MKGLIMAIMMAMSGADAPAQMHSGPGLALTPHEEATHRAVASGDWSDPATWEGGRVPGAAARVLVPEGIAVTIGAELAPEIKTLRIDGIVDFAADRNTELKVDTLVSSHTGALVIGTEETPIRADVTAKVTIADDGAIDRAWDPGLISRGALLHGRTEIHGAEKTAFAAVDDFPRAGDMMITLEGPPVGWRVGDTLSIAGTDPTDPASDEVVSIAAIRGADVILDRPLSRDHVAPRADLDVHVANLTRNVQFSSENDGALNRGHVMFMHTNDADLNFVSFDDMGRTDKRRPVDDFEIVSEVEGSIGSVEIEELGGANVRGRYSVHFHRGGTEKDGAPAKVNGAVVTDDVGWAYVNHSSHVEFTNNVAHNTAGAAYNTEAGDEIGAFIGNIAIRSVNPTDPFFLDEFAQGEIIEPAEADERLQRADYGWQGDGFWLHGANVTLKDNVVAGASGHAYIYWGLGLVEKGLGERLVDVANLPNGHLIGPDGTMVRTKHVPIAAFDGNESYGSATGLAVYYVHTDHRDDPGFEQGDLGLAPVPQEYEDQLLSTFSNSTFWNVARTGIEGPYAGRLAFENVEVLGAGLSDSTGVRFDHFANENRFELRDLAIRNFEIGLAAPRQGDVTVQDVALANAVDVLITYPDTRSRDLKLKNLSFEELPEGTALAADDRVRIAMDLFAELETEEELLFLTDPERLERENPELFELLTDVFGEPEVFAEEIGADLAFDRYFTLDDRITLKQPGEARVGLYYEDQAPGAVPAPEGGVLAAYIPEIAGLTNAEIKAQFGVALGGTVAPARAAETGLVDGGLVGRPRPARDVDVTDDIDPAEPFEAGALTIAFIGDSITEGVGEGAYPGRVAERFGDDIAVRNFGVGGSGVTPRAEIDIRETEEYAALLQSAPDVIYVMFGGNDIAGGASAALFETSLREVVEELQSLPSNPTLILGAPPPFGAFDAAADRVFKAEFIPVIERIAAENGLEFVNVNAGVDDYPANYPDLVHPNSAGAETIARLVTPSVEAAAEARGADPGERADVMRGASGDDVIRGDADDDRISGRGGDDRLKGGAGDDTLRGQGGEDTLKGGVGSDLLKGGAGADRLVGGGGQDTLSGGRGPDTLKGGGGADLFIIGAGDDILDFRTGRDQIDASALGLTDFGDLVIDAGEDGLIVTGDAGTATFRGLSQGDLSAEAFVFADGFDL